MAKMHNDHYAAGGTMMGRQGAAFAEHQHGEGGDPGRKEGGGMMSGGGMMTGGGMMMTAATASFEDTDGGARLVLRPNSPAQLKALRQHVRLRVERMAGGECLMMSPGAAVPSPNAVGADHESHHRSPPGK